MIDENSSDLDMELADRDPTTVCGSGFESGADLAGGVSAATGGADFDAGAAVLVGIGGKGAWNANLRSGPFSERWIVSPDLSHAKRTGRPSSIRTSTPSEASMIQRLLICLIVACSGCRDSSFGRQTSLSVARPIRIELLFNRSVR